MTKVEIKETKGINREHRLKSVPPGRDAMEKCGGVAAFFDLDGTLLPGPSLERRFLRSLHEWKLIGMASYLRWFGEAVRLAPRGIREILHANKMYLRGVAADAADGRREKKRARGIAGAAFCTFFREAMERLSWHAEHRHAIVIVSGTLEPLAKRAAVALEGELACCGIGASIEACATRLEVIAGMWTGRIVGEAMFGEAKARAIRRFSASRGIELSRCFAYGNSTTDRWMLEAAGKAVAVNPSNDLERIAVRNGWESLRWMDGGISTQSSEKSKSSVKDENGRAIGKEMRAASAKPGKWT